MSRNVLVIAPHPDDETLGAGGFIAKCAAAGDAVTVVTVSGHLPPLYKREAYEKTVDEAMLAHKALGVAHSEFLEYPCTKLGDVPVAELNGSLVKAVEEAQPEVVLIPYSDRHIDHQQVFQAAMVATRPVAAGRNIKMLAAYETLSETHWNAPHLEPNFIPNWVVDISDYMDTKLAALAHYESQIPPFPGPRSLEAIKALAVFRGTQAGFAYGEGMHVIRYVS